MRLGTTYIDISWINADREYFTYLTFRLLPRNTLSLSTRALATRLGSVNSTYAYLQTPISVPFFAAKLLPGSEDLSSLTRHDEKS